MNGPLAVEWLPTSISPFIWAMALAVLLALAAASAIPPLRTLPTVIGGAGLACVPMASATLNPTCAPSLLSFFTALVLTVVCVSVVHAGVAAATGASSDSIAEQQSVAAVCSLLTTWLLLQSAIIDDALTLGIAALCEPVGLQSSNHLLQRTIRLLPSLLAFRVTLDLTIACVTSTRGSVSTDALQYAASIAPALLVIWLLQHPDNLLADIDLAMQTIPSDPP